MGLLIVGPEGGLATLVASQAQGVPFAFTNGLDISEDTGLLYFTDSSTRYPRRYNIITHYLIHILFNYTSYYAFSIFGIKFNIVRASYVFLAHINCLQPYCESRI